MSYQYVNNILVDGNSQPVKDAIVTVYLCVPSFTDDGSTEIITRVAKVRTKADGSYQLRLIPNSELQTPDTFYIIKQPDGVTHNIIVPATGGPFNVGDLLVGTLPVPPQSFSISTGFRPEMFGAKGDGIHDDTVAIQTAINAAAAASVSGGCGVTFSTGIYAISAPLVIPSGISLVGVDMGATIIRATPSFSGGSYMIGNPTGALHWSMTITDIQVDGNSAGGAVVGHGIYLYGGSDSIIQRTRVVNCSGNGITLDGSGTYLGTAVKIVNCYVRSCGAIGIANQANATDTLIQGCDVGPCTSHAIYVGASNCSLVGSIGWGSNVGLYIDSTVVVFWASGCRFDNNGQMGIYSKGREVLINGTVVHDNSHNATGTIAGIKIDTGAGKHMLNGVRSAGGLIAGQTQQSYGLELGTGRTGLTTVRSCDFSGNGTGGIGGDQTNLHITQTTGVNPAGYLGSPAVPASGTGFVNPYPYDCTVYLHGGSISGITVNGQGITTYFGIPPVRVPRGSTVALTYTGSPQWDWYDN